MSVVIMKWSSIMQHKNTKLCLMTVNSHIKYPLCGLKVYFHISDKIISIIITVYVYFMSINY